MSLTVERIEKLLAESSTFKIEPGNYIVCYDVNQLHHAQVREIADILFKQFGMNLVLIGYDPHMGPDGPLQLFKVME